MQDVSPPRVAGSSIVNCELTVEVALITVRLPVMIRLELPVIFLELLMFLVFVLPLSVSNKLISTTVCT